MKKLLVFAAVFLFLATHGYGQSTDSIKKEINTLRRAKTSTQKMIEKEREKLRKLEGAEVSYMSKQNFAADFGDVSDVKWQRMETYDEVSFTKDGKVQNA